MRAQMVRERCLCRGGKFALTADEAINYTWKALRKRERFDLERK